MYAAVTRVGGQTYIRSLHHIIEDALSQYTPLKVKQSGVYHILDTRTECVLYSFHPDSQRWVSHQVTLRKPVR